MAKKSKKKDAIDGGRFKRAKPSGTYRGHPSNGPTLDRRNGETMLTPELTAKIVNLILAGNYIEVAARANGIDGKTLRKWLKLGGMGDPRYAPLAEAVQDAAAKGEALDVANIAKHAQKDWRASAWRLERKHFRRWGRRDSLEITGDEDKPLVVSNGRLDPSRLDPAQRALFEQLMDAMRPPQEDEDEEADGSDAEE